MGDFNPQRTLSGAFFVIPECLASICAVVLAFTANKHSQLRILGDSPPLASFHCYGTLLTTFPRWHFDDGTSTITILVDIMMLGQCMLLTIASDMVNLIPRLVECTDSDYAESYSSK